MSVIDPVHTFRHRGMTRLGDDIAKNLQGRRQDDAVFYEQAESCLQKQLKCIRSQQTADASASWSHRQCRRTGCIAARDTQTII